MADTLSWGIIRYAVSSGFSPESDCAAFDGWYTDRAEALEVYKFWCRIHPHWTVALVQFDEARFSNATWATWDKAAPGRSRDGTPLCPLKRIPVQQTPG
jgi:hypothetical protein